MFPSFSACFSIFLFLKWDKVSKEIQLKLFFTGILYVFYNKKQVFVSQIFVSLCKGRSPKDRGICRLLCYFVHKSSTLKGTPSFTKEDRMHCIIFWFLYILLTFILCGLVVYLYSFDRFFGFDKICKMSDDSSDDF